MKITTLGVLAAIILIAMPAFAVEIDCPPLQFQKQGAFQVDDGLLDEELIRKRRQAREAELARVKEQWLARSRSQAQPVAPEEQDTQR